MEKHGDTENNQKPHLITPEFIVAKEHNCNHIPEQDFWNFHNGIMTEEELLIFMEHIGSCSDCADRFASYQEQDLLHTPVNFKRDIITETSRLSHSLRSSKQAFYRYCLQVGFSMAASLVLVFSGTHLKLTEHLSKARLPKTEFSVTTYMTEQLEQLTDTISISWEELFHDKKEK